MTTIEQRKGQLEARLAELQGRLKRIEQEFEHPPVDVVEAEEPQDEEVLEDLGEAGVQEIRMIEAALDRIRQGEYGVCANCGEKIDEKRLDAVPAAPLCADCARAA